MKLFAIFMLTFTLGTYASGFSQKQLVTLDLKQCDVHTLFQEIWKQTGLRFVYNEKDVTGLQKMDVKVTQQQVDEVLDNLFRHTPYRCSFESDVIYITPRIAKPQEKQEKVTITGNVKDKNGNPLPGVTVFLGNTSIGTSTDIYGNYQLSILKGTAADITYSFIGMKKVVYHFPATVNLVHNVVLEEDHVELKDVVVIGYGTKSGRNLTSSVSSVKAEDLEKYANGATSFDNMIGGALKGVMVTQNTGDPGQAATINVRGITSPYGNMSTQSANEPLYVIDGVPFFIDKSGLNPLLTISPSDIESIDVLKDAAATSIYGSRGANGVIIVNTKAGRRNQKMTISAGYTLSIGNPVKRYNPLNTKEFKEVQELLIRNSVDAYNQGDDMVPIWDLMSIANLEMADDMTFQYNGLLDEVFGNANTNWVKETQNKNALTQQYNIAIRGGSETTNYSFSLTATNQEGLYIRDRLKRYGARLSVDSDISKRFRVGASLNYTFSKRNSGQNDIMGSLSREWTERPDIPVYDEQGKLTTIDRSLMYGGPVSGPNPVASYMVNNDKKSYQFMGNSYLECKILENLKIRGDINVSVFQNDYSQFIPTIALEDFSQYPGMEMPTEAMLFEGQGNTANTSVNFRADYALEKNDHHLNAMIGYGWDRLFYTARSQSYTGFPDDKVLTNASSAYNQQPATSSKSNSGLNSVYARLSYSYADRYLAEVNFRSDASSKFGPGNQRGYFPSVSLGWRISSEEFMQNNSFTDDLKVRLSYGKTGSTNIEDFTYKQFFTRSTSNMWGSLPTIRLSSVLPNQDVKWEMTTEYNIGLDFSFFNRYLYGSIDAYWRKTDGALMPSPLPFESGMQTFTTNLTDMSNKGFELEIASDILRRNDWRWTAKFNIALNRNKIEKLNGANINPYMMNAFTEGYPAGISKGYIVEGIFQSQEEVNRKNEIAQAKGYEYYISESTSPGDYIYRDVDGDGRITTADGKNVIASPEPDFFGGFINNVGYKNWNLSFVFQFSHGAEAELNSLSTSATGSPLQSIHRELFHNTWSPENKNAQYARLYYSYYNENTRKSDKYVFSTSYLRLKNITLSYTLPQNWLNKLNIQSAMIFVSASNIWTITNWPGLDPELTGSYTTLKTSSDDPYPLSKNFSVGVKLQF